MSKPFIVLGDKTSHGGTVLSGCPTATTHGKPIARVGDKVSCPKCGPTTIASGDSTQIIMGKPVARHGDKTACGATLIAGQAVTVTSSGGGSTSSGGNSGHTGTASHSNTTSSTNASTNNPRAHLAQQAATNHPAQHQNSASASKADNSTTHTFEFKGVTHQYNEYQPAYLFIKGAGINGGYSIDGYIRVEGSSLSVSAMGRTPVSNMGTVDFFGSVKVTRSGQTVAHRSLSLDESSDWPINGSQPIGSATLKLPAPSDMTPLQVVITAGYVYKTAGGEAIPEPSQTSVTYDIGVQEHASN